jgi:hypothetical protein
VAAGETPTSAPSLEQILWRAMDRFREEPALVDAEEFAQHIAHAFDAEVPEEAFADRFFEGADRLHRRATFAASVVRAAQRRLHVYEFDLDRLEYVIVEDERDVVVVSEFGQFRVENDDSLGRALEAAVVKRPERAGVEPRAYFVRASGEVLGVEVAKVARTLERLKLRQVSMPPVRAPGKRLASFNPVRREMGEAREQRALEQRVELSGPGPAVWDGRATIGSGARWERMVGPHADAPGRRIVVQTGSVVAIVAARPREFAGERALARGDVLAAVRSGDAPVQALASERAAAAFEPGSQLAFAAAPDAFWVQPEAAFAVEPALRERTFVARPLQLGQITGDPWADWALTAGQPMQPASADREQVVAAVEPGRAARRRELRLEDAPIVAFRAPDGRLVVNGPSSPMRVADLDRPDAPAALRASGDLVPKTGALPVVALRALQLALERTAAAGGYRLPAVRIGQAPDAIATGRALSLRSLDDRRRSVRLAAPATARDHAARLVVSMPFPNRGQLHVGEDLADALHAYLAAPVMPLVHARLPAVGHRESPPGAVALQSEKVRSGHEALLTLELPAVAPSPASTLSVSDLPLLLRRALADSGSWKAGPGAPLPLAVRELVEGSPFRAAAQAPAVARRPPGPGEEEIVIPLPLWAQMGRGTISETGVLVSPPGATGAYAPPLGAYRLVAARHGGVDPAAPARRGAAVELLAPEVLPADLSGPATLRLSRRPAGHTVATALGDRYLVRRVPLEDSAAPLDARGPLPAAGSGTGFVLPELVAGGPDAALPGRPVASGALQPEFIPRPGAATLPARAMSPPPRAAALPSGSVAASGARSAAAGATVAATKMEGARTAMALPPGSWSADRAGAPRSAYATRAPAGSREPGAVIVAGPAGAGRRQVPVSLRFRYVEAPLWWSSGHAAQVREDLPPDAFRAVRAGLGAANTATALWRSILVAGAGSEGPAAMAAAAEASRPVPSRLDGLGAVLPVPAPAIAAGGPAYIAMSSAGAAGAVPAPAAARARAQAIEMSIVAAIPPAPPPLSTMSSSSVPGAGAPLARGRGPGQDAAPGGQKEAAEAVSHSKIEGSVDAIAQRIYHRIRRRLQSDRERFGG